MRAHPWRTVFRLALVAGLVGAITPASPTASTYATANLIRNPGAEASPGVACTDNSGVLAPVGWQTTGALTAIRVDCDPPVQGAAGSQIFAGGPTRGTSTARQDVDLAPYAGAIDGGSTRATLSALLGGWQDQGDYATVTATFVDGNGRRLDTITIGPVTAAQRGNRTALLPRSATGTVPVGARVAQVVLSAFYVAGAIYNDGYADNISLTLQPGSVAPKPKPGRLRFSVVVKGKPASGGGTLFPSFAGTRIAGSGAFLQRRTYLEYAAGTIVVEQRYDVIPDVRTTIEPTGAGSYLQGKAAYLRMRVEVTRSTFTGCRPGRTGQIILVDSARGADSVSLSLCGDSLLYRNGKPKGTLVKVFVSRL